MLNLKCFLPSPTNCATSHKKTFSNVQNPDYNKDHSISLTQFQILQSCLPHLLNIREYLYIAPSKPAINAQQSFTQFVITDTATA